LAQNVPIQNISYAKRTASEQIDRFTSINSARELCIIGIKPLLFRHKAWVS